MYKLHSCIWYISWNNWFLL